ncbi:MAG TPA: M12 family metallo-peptidase, partial [Saprospiraceae bacterium]|nr:M12 family metallo-peptidase [Saprospiraceae bacterium]
KWPTWDYYNIWVVHDICGSIAGYAYYPNGGEYDGTVIDIVSMKYESGVLAHEIGHGFNLKHTFSGDDNNECPINDDCLEDGDEICDTPPHRTNDCGTNNPCSSEGIWLNSKYN